MKVAGEGITSPLEKTLGPETLKKLAEAVGAKAGDLIVAAAAKEQIEHNDMSLNEPARFVCILATSST